MAEDSKVSATDTPQQAVQQQADRSWPVPGDEGYVHPDGSPMSAQQLEDNKRAAADRAAAGSSVHGAPMATPGPQAADEAAAAVARAEATSKVTAADAEKGLTEFVEQGHERAAEKASDAGEPAAPKSDATKRTATTDGGKTSR
jgi:hypothetical protein